MVRPNRKMEIYAYLRHAILDLNIHPSYRDIAKFFSYKSKTSITKIMKQLQIDGLIYIIPKKHRSIILREH